MCGRYALAIPVDDLQRRFGFAARPNLAPGYSIAPTLIAFACRWERWTSHGGQPVGESGIIVRAVRGVVPDRS